MQLSTWFRITLATVLVALCALVARSSAKRSDAEILDNINKFEKCVLQVIFSFTDPDYYPPRTLAELDQACKRTAAGVKCLKEQTKGAEPLIRRGMVALAGSRGRQSKALCANPNANDKAKSFLAANKCLMEKRQDELKALDMRLFKTMAAILQRNYNDSTPELKQICCALHDFKQDAIRTASAACPAHRTMIEELLNVLVSEETSIICDDTDKLNKSCPQLQRLPIDKIPDPRTSNTKVPRPAALSIYLLATLGEASDTPIKFE